MTGSTCRVFAVLKEVAASTLEVWQSLFWVQVGAFAYASPPEVYAAL